MSDTKSDAGPSGTRPEPVLRTSGVSFGYNNVPVVRDLSLTVGAGEVVALLGANGAGKTTTLLGLAGVMRPFGGAVVLAGHPAPHTLHRRARRGLSFVPSERPVVRSLTVRDNLRIGRGGVDKAVAIFPELGRLLDRKAGLVSGGEQQMLTLARALAVEPAIVLADELSLGLAPLIVHRLLEVLRGFADQGVGVLLVEQQIGYALESADHVYVMRRGEIAMQGPVVQMRERVDEIEACYFSTVDAPDASGSAQGETAEARPAAATAVAGE
ncbi:MAG: putative branched-chain amino acid transporter ATP-binding protein [Gemmatimonadales bacterium]|jgi:branched-chain amino acid transport system ATP-binding protein|nr:putative branched-chain amino acid transporter ATP-binding protein [Gemmatimonadales bacterium]